MQAEIILQPAWMEVEPASIVDEQPEVSKHSVRVLIVDDTPADAALLVRTLERNGYSVQWLRVDTPSGMRMALMDQVWDLVVCDHLMPRLDSPTALSILRESGLDIPFLMVSGAVEPDVAVELMRLGAHDYLFKDDLSRLATTVARELAQTSARLQQREAQAQADLALARYTELYDQAPIGYFTLGRQGQVVQANQMAAALVGLSIEQLLDRAFFDFVISADRMAFRDFIAVAFGGRSLNACQIRIGVHGTRLQRIVRIETTGTTDEQHVRIVMTDITALARTQQQIHHAKKQWEASVDAVSEMIVVTDAATRIVRCNRALVDAFGGTYQDLIGRTIGDVFADARLESLPWADGDSPDYEVRRGATILSVRRFATSDAANRGSVYVLQDVTEQKRMLEAITALNGNLTLRTSALEDMNANLRSFCASVSHDLRAPLRRMDSWGQAMEQDCSNLDAPAREYLAQIRSESRRMIELVDAMLRLSRIGEQGLCCQAVDLSALAHAVAGRQQVQYGSQTQLQVQPGMVVQGDSRLLEIALTNLLDNAYKFSARAEAPRIEVGLAQGEAAPTFYVRDNGVGFDPAQAGRLFAPFQRLHEEQEFPGTGVGLATVQRVVAAHGGRAWAESSPGQGTAIYCQFGGAGAQVMDAAV